MRSVMRTVRSRVEPPAPYVTETNVGLRDLVVGGKRLRPAFCYWGWRGAGGADDEAIVTVATSFELLHACAIIHDDVMDASDLRRGRPSVHQQFASLHRGAGWRGDSAG